MKPDAKIGKRKKLTSVLGLTLDGSRLEGVVLKRTNGSLQQLQRLSAQLTLDPLTAAPELVGREIRNQLDAAGIREKYCVVGIPLRWVLTAQTELPALPPDDAASLLQLEAEKSFHTDITGLQLGQSASVLAGGKQWVLLAGVPHTQAGALEQVLAAAKLKPVSFTLGLTALGATKPAAGRISLVVGESMVGLQIQTGDGLTALRALEGTVETVGGRPVIQAATVAREIRITLGQLPAELRATVKEIVLLGPPESVRSLADELELKFEAAGLAIVIQENYPPNTFGVTLPAGASLSAAFSLAANQLVERPPVFEFLPPRPSLAAQFVKKYTSGKFGTAGAVAGTIAVLILLLFFIQQIQLWRLRSQWSHMQTKVTELQQIQDQIRFYRPWYDDTYPGLSILRELSLAFPEDGSVTAKSIEVRSGGAVSCSGNARDNTALLAVLNRLRSAPGVTELKLNQIRGKSPMQFTFDFQYGTGGGQ